MMPTSSRPPQKAIPTSPASRSGAEPRRPRLQVLKSRAKDVLLASDPGFTRLLMSLQLMAAIGLTIGVIYAYEQLTHALWVEAPAGAALPAAAAAELAVQHQAITLLAMMLGGIVAMLSSFAAMETSRRSLALTMALMPLPMLATMALALAVASDRTLSLALLALTMGVGVYLRKFVPLVGPRAFLCGVLLFIGFFFGFLSHGSIGESQLGAIALILWLAAAFNFVFKLAISIPLAHGRLGRVRSSFRARARAVLAAAVTMLAADSEEARDKASAQLHRRLGRLNETALVIDGLVADPENRDAGSGRAHALIFELELLVGNIGRLSERLASAGLPARLNSELRGWLDDLRGGHADRAAAAALAFDDAGGSELESLTEDERNRLRYLAEAVVELATLTERFEAAPLREEVTFESPVTLVFGELPGSSLVSAATATAPGRGRGDKLRERLGLSLPAQVAIRVTLAVAAASALGSIISERRFYWAVLAVFITFMGTNTSGEQIDKALRRVAGTVIGIGIGSVLAHAIGLSAWSIPVILVSLGIGVYFMKVNYLVMTIGITVTVSQLYEQLGEYTDQLLLLRLAETTLGAVIAAAAALLIFPVDTRRAARTAARAYLSSLGELLGGIADRLGGNGEDAEAPRLSSAARALDNATQQLVATARPLRRASFHRAELEHNLGLFTYVAGISRNLVATVEGESSLEPELARQVAAALNAERQRVEAIEALLEGGAGDPAAPATAEGAEPIGRRLAADALAPSRPEHRLVQRVDRLDQAITELGTNLAGAR